MRKAKPRMSGPKATRKGASATVDDYVAAAPEPARRALERMRAVIRSAVPATAVETISYRIPAIEYKGVLLWFAAFDRHVSLFPKATIIEKFRGELKGYATSTGTIQFPISRRLPVSLIRRIVKARVAEVDGRTKAQAGDPGLKGTIRRSPQSVAR